MPKPSLTPKVRELLADPKATGRPKIQAPTDTELPVDPGFVGAMGLALNPRVGANWMDKALPFLTALAILGLAVGCAFGFVPGADFQDSLLLLGAFGGGAYVRHAGRR